MTASELKDIVDMCRAQGITELVMDGVSLKLTPQAPIEVKIPEPEPEDKEVDPNFGLTKREMEEWFYSSG